VYYYHNSAVQDLILNRKMKTFLFRAIKILLY